MKDDIDAEIGALAGDVLRLLDRTATMRLDPARWPATIALERFWRLVRPHDIEIADAPGNKTLPPEAYTAELEHYTWTLRVWNGWQDDRFIAKRIEDMSMAEFARWSRMKRPAFEAWRRWVITAGRLASAADALGAEDLRPNAGPAPFP